MPYPLSIEAVIKKFDLQPNKKLGQNFLLDSDITDKIVRCAGKLENFHVLEIGPGAGTLTRSILFAHPDSITAVEMDDRCYRAILDLQQFYPEILKVVHADALKINFSDLCASPKYKIIANLPYNIGTELLIKFLYNLHLFDSITIMLQKEVVERLISQPGNKSYGRLSIITQLLAITEKNFDVEPECFYPPPRVTSSVITLKPRPAPLFECSLDALSSLTNLLFQQRRKMIRSILKNKAENIEKLLTSLNISPTSRPEQLTIEQFCLLARHFS